MTEIRIKAIDDLIRLLNEFTNRYAYRGHADSSWRMASSLERTIGDPWSPEMAKKFESHSLGRFRSRFHLYDRENKAPSSTLAWLSLMQHYGVPTRLLDFTLSPYVALYFAAEAFDPRTPTDLAIHAIDYEAIMAQSIEVIRNHDKDCAETNASVCTKQDAVFEDKLKDRDYDAIWMTEPGQLNARLDRQAGCFLLSANRARRIEGLLDSPAYRDCDHQKLIIDRHLYEAIYALLRKLNINSKNIYGDLTGLGRSIRMELQVYSIDHEAFANGADPSAQSPWTSEDD